MKKILTILSLSILLVSCGGKAEKAGPVQTALREFILERYPELDKVTFETIEETKTVTFDEEILRREKLFALRMKQDDGLYKKFVQEGKQKNAQLRYDSLLQDIRIKNGIDSIRVKMGDGVNDVAFTVYTFTAKAEGKDKVLNFRENLAAVTPDYTVVNLAPKSSELYKATGRVIPGYRELLKGDEASAEEVGLAE